MSLQVSFPGLRSLKNPTIEQIAALFLEHFPKAWVDDADVTFFMPDGGFKRLSIVANSEYGIWLWYRCNYASGDDENFISLGSLEGFNEYVEVNEDALTLVGLFVSPEDAWLAVQDFLLNNGLRSEKIAWVHESEIPEGKYWLVSSDRI